MHISTYFFAKCVVSHFQCVKILFNSFVFFDFLVKLVLQLLRLLNNETTYVWHDHLPAYYPNQNYIKLLVHPNYGVQFRNLHVFTEYLFNATATCSICHIYNVNAIVMNHNFLRHANFAPEHEICDKYGRIQQCHRISNMPLISAVTVSVTQYFNKHCSATNVWQAPAAFQLICSALLQWQDDQVMPVISSPTFLSLSGQLHVHAANEVQSNTEMQFKWSTVKQPVKGR